MRRVRIRLRRVAPRRKVRTKAARECLQDMGSRVSRSVAYFLLVLAFTPGCSWLFVQPPPKNYDGRGQLACTTNMAPPVLDTIFTVTNIGSTLYVAGQDNVQDQGSRVALGLTVAGLWLASAIYGYTETS